MPKRRKDSEKNPATLTKISTKLEFLETKVTKIDLALFGKNGRGGLVKDVQEIKSATSIFKSVMVPIITAIISAAITAGILGAL